MNDQPTAADALAVKRFTNAAGCVATIPPGLAIPLNAVIELHQEGAGQVEVAAGTGVTIQSADGARKTSMQFAAAGIRRVGDNIYTLFGDIEGTGSGGGGSPDPGLESAIAVGGGAVGSGATYQVRPDNMDGMQSYAVFAFGTRYQTNDGAARGTAQVGFGHRTYYSGSNYARNCWAKSRSGLANTETVRRASFKNSLIALDSVGGAYSTHEIEPTLQVGGVDLYAAKIVGSEQLIASALVLSGEDCYFWNNAWNLGTDLWASFGNQAWDYNLGYNPMCTIFYSTDRAHDSIGQSSGFSFTIGFATQTEQRCVAMAESNGVSEGSPRLRLFDDKVAAGLAANGAMNWGLAYTPNPDGFLLTQSSGNGGNGNNAEVNSLAIENGTKRCKIVDFDIPTGTGPWSISGCPFTPSSAILVLTTQQVVGPGPITIANQQTGFGIAFVSTDSVTSHTIRIASEAETTDTAQSASIGEIILSKQATDRALRATFDTWLANGVLLDVISGLPGGGKGFAVFFE